MGFYSADYTNDLGYLFAKAGLSVYAVREGDRQETERTFDEQYLPQILAATLTTNQLLCNVVSGTRTLRYAQVWLSSTEWIYMPCPWQGGTNEFMQFYQQLQADTRFLLVAHHGETINDWYTRIYAT